MQLSYTYSARECGRRRAGMSSVARALGVVRREHVDLGTPGDGAGWARGGPAPKFDDCYIPLKRFKVDLESKVPLLLEIQK